MNSHIIYFFHFTISMIVLFLVGLTCTTVDNHSGYLLNIAYGKETHQLGHKTSGNVVDHCLDTCSFIGGECGRENQGAWWLVRFTTQYYVENVTICNTFDETESTYLKNFNVKIDNDTCAYHKEVVNAGSCVNINCTGIGTELAIEKKIGLGVNKMTLCEVIVRGKPHEKGIISFDKAIFTASSSFDHTQLIDGSEDTCTSISPRVEKEATWLLVNLQGLFLINQLVVCNANGAATVNEADIEVKVDDTGFCSLGQKTYECLVYNCNHSGQFVSLIYSNNMKMTEAELQLCELTITGITYNMHLFNQNSRKCRPTCGDCSIIYYSVCLPVEIYNSNIDCKDKNGGCSQICLQGTNVVTKCSCKYGYILAADGKTCYVDIRYQMSPLLGIGTLAYILFASMVFWKEDFINLMENEITYDIFISYKAGDEENCRFVNDTLLPMIENMGYKCCIDTRDFKGGQHIENAIVDAIKRSRIAVLVISPAYVHPNSHWTLQETEYALREVRRRKKLRRTPYQIIPIIYQSVNISTISSPHLNFILCNIIPIGWMDVAAHIFREKLRNALK